jgi:CubicO group peptidase (beta-lactamase class C family)
MSTASCMKRRTLISGGLAGGAALMLSGGRAGAAQKTSAGGFSPSRLKHLTTGMQGYIDRGIVAGVHTLIHRRGTLAHSDVLGWQDEEAKTPLRRDTIYRIASMSKPITCVAALMLMEEGRFRLEDPIDKWLPELANRRVLKNPAGSLEDTYPAPRPITVEDLLTQRPGLASGLGGAEGPMVAALAGLRDAGNMDEWLARVGKLPLVAAPGEQFIYGAAHDILGHLVARVSGMSYADFLQTRLFGPLGMVDTAFWVPKEKLSRLSVAYGFDAVSGKKSVSDAPTQTRVTAPPKIASGAGGLVSTGDDYLKFGRMLLGHGRLGDVRILSRKTVELMTTDFLTPEQRKMPFFGDTEFWKGQGYGLGVSVTDNIAQRREPASEGQYGWNGAFGTLWVNDPKEEMTAILMIQTAFAETSARIQRDFRMWVYQAIDD